MGPAEGGPAEGVEALFIDSLQYERGLDADRERSAGNQQTTPRPLWLGPRLWQARQRWQRESAPGTFRRSRTNLLISGAWRVVAAAHVFPDAEKEVNQGREANEEADDGDECRTTITAPRDDN